MPAAVLMVWLMVVVVMVLMVLMVLVGVVFVVRSRLLVTAVIPLPLAAALELPKALNLDASC